MLRDDLYGQQRDAGAGCPGARFSVAEGGRLLKSRTAETPEPAAGGQEKGRAWGQGLLLRFLFLIFCWPLDHGSLANSCLPGMDPGPCSYQG